MPLVLQLFLPLKLAKPLAITILFRGAHASRRNKVIQSHGTYNRSRTRLYTTAELVLKTGGCEARGKRNARGSCSRETGSIRQEFTTKRARKKTPRGPGRGGQPRRLPRVGELEPKRCRAPFRPRRRMRRAARRAYPARRRPRRGARGAFGPRVDDRLTIGHSGASSPVG